MSKATNPGTHQRAGSGGWRQHSSTVDVRMPALSEFPMISVVQPAYHCLPNGGHGSFLPSARRRLSWERVFATAGPLGRPRTEGEGVALPTLGGVCDC